MTTCPKCSTAVTAAPYLAAHPSPTTKGLCAMTGLLPETAEAFVANGR